MNLDNKLKNILTEILNLQTKFLNDDKLIIVEDKTPPDEVIVTPKANNNLHSFISCKDGNLFVRPDLEMLEVKSELGFDEWLDREKRLFENNKVNQISACQYQGKIKRSQDENYIEYWKVAAQSGIDIPQIPASEKKTKTEDELTKDQDEYIKNCIILCYEIYSNLPKSCSMRVKIKNVVYSYGYKDWFHSQYKKYEKDPSFITLEPYELYMKGDYYNYTNGIKIPIEISDLITKEKDIKDELTKPNYGYEKDWGLPLTTKEWQMMHVENPFNPDNSLKLGEGSYICLKDDASSVNLRTSPEINEREGVLDYWDNWIAWSNSTIIGKYIESKVSMTPIYEGSEFSEPFGKFKDKVIKDPDKFKKVFEEVEKVTSKTFPFTSQVYINELEDYYGGGRYTNFFLQIAKSVYFKLSNDSKDFISNMINGWYYVELLNKIRDRTASYLTLQDLKNMTYKKVWVSTQTTEFCKTEIDEKTKKTIITNTNFETEANKGLVLKGLKNIKLK